MKTAKIFASALVCAIAAAGIASSPAARNPESTLQRAMRTSNAIYTNLAQYYVDTLDIDSVMRLGMGYMLATLDPYTEYYTQEEADRFRAGSNGEYGGIGVRIATYDGQAYFTDPMEGKPAFRAGLRSGDKIIKVDSTSTRGRDGNFATGLIRGQAGKSVTVTVVRPCVQDSVLTFTMQREKLTIPAVPYYTVLDGGIGYIELNTFSPDDTGEQVRHALEELRGDKQLKGIILDLSDNGGGLLSQAIDIASMFLPKGTKVLETRGRVGDDESSRVLRTVKEPIFADIPLAVIINRGSASASEVLAGALQDHDRAVLVGERSFGKGLVQSTLSMPYGGMLKVTTAKYYIPSGRLIQAVDYSHRDAEGRPGYTPDSLARTMYTVAGRPVREGGGLQPEVCVKDSIEHWDLIYNLVSRPYLFNFANRYRAAHPDVDTFTMTDEVWEEFVTTLPDTALRYESRIYKGLEQLRSAAKKEGLMTAQTEAQFAALEKSLRRDAGQELTAARSEIERYLVPMLAERYGFDRAAEQAEVAYDPIVQAARDILLDSARYRSLLARPAKQK